jgi:hypothetical protein
MRETDEKRDEERNQYFAESAREIRREREGV